MFRFVINNFASHQDAKIKTVIINGADTIFFCLYQHCVMHYGERLCSQVSRKDGTEGGWVGLGMGAVHKVAVVAGSRKALVKSPNYMKVW